MSEIQFLMKGSEARRQLDFSQMVGKDGKSQHISFSGNHKGDRYRSIECVVSNHTLDKEYGGAHLLLISPAFILVNETGSDIRYTYHSNFVSSQILPADRFCPIVFSSEAGSEVIKKMLYFNFDPKK